ncbi:hypothetical protein H0266_13955 [Halobacillus locisalis]|uniref:Uncharacterized protein n=1 Tax=Halobacillus locisalis TaxID=220753 RepID=A0A838CWK6_9BACI|nr:hypothetical protein [Halobacillus locisalis]MBA2175996.1 hypothetical protein [Halobacillus locisalis]
MTYDMYPKRIPMMAALLAPIIILETSGVGGESLLGRIGRYGLYLLIAMLFGLCASRFKLTLIL